MRLTVGNLKGGVGKTTTGTFLAAGLARRGRTLLIDSDPVQASAQKWAELAGEDWPKQLVVISWSSKDLARRIAAVADDYENLVVDTGPKDRGLLRAALASTGRLVLPVSPRALDLAEISETLTLAAEVDMQTPVEVSVLLTQVRSSSRSAGDAREVLADELGYPVLGAEVHLRESYARAFGTYPTDLGEYHDVLSELDALDPSAAPALFTTHTTTKDGTR